MSAIAIIPARGGSKRIPRKNIREFYGKPIIAYSIEAAISSSIFDHVMVSTDDLEIASVAREYGAEVPFMRSKETANDFATTEDVLREVINEYSKREITSKYTCLLYPTAPFVTAQKLVEAYRILSSSQDINSILTVTQFSFPPQRGFTCKDGILFPADPDSYMLRSQDLEPVYHDCGQFHFFKTDVFLSEHEITDRIHPMLVPEIEEQDIDSLEDWELAEVKYRFNKALCNGIID